MQRVSNAYRESMKSPIRERAYIMLSFGLINQEAQAHAKVEDGAFAYYSCDDTIFGQNAGDITYATMEENFTKVDGSMYFLPHANESNRYMNTGIVSQDLVSESVFELTISLNMPATDIKGITIDFGENYPVNFDLIGSNNQTFQYQNNDKSVFVSEDVLEDTSKVTLKVHSMKNPDSRARIYSIRFGYGLTFYNSDVLDSSLESYVSPIGADIPQIDFTVQLKNYDHYFNVDNPKSAINFLETGQQMSIHYGYQLPDDGGIEWIEGNNLLCAEWESDDYTATIRCHDIFRGMDSEYYKGTYTSAGKSYYDLAVDVMSDAGLTDYYIDPQLKSLYTKNPLPRVKHKEALQIIANACRCVLTQTRQGTVQIKSNFIPESSASATSQSPYSNVANIMEDTLKDEYSTLATNYTTVDGGMLFIPRDIDGNVLNTGYVSSEQSGEDGTFATNPVITITQEVACMYYGVKLVFGAAIPSEFIIKTYNDGELVEEYTCHKEYISKTTVIHHGFSDFDVMKIEFTKTAQPYNRIVLNYFTFGDITNFTMSRNDMTCSPKVIKQELVKQIEVPCYFYQSGATEETLLSEDVTVVSGDEEIFFLGEPSYGLRAAIENVDNGVTLVESGSYYLKLKFNVTGTYRLNVYGRRYKIVERYVVKELNNRGKTVKWENPLMSDMSMAGDLSDWLGDYYNANVEYEYTTRGNPEMDANDIIYQENKFVDGMKVNVYRNTINFKQSFSGKVTVRRVGT